MSHNPEHDLPNVPDLKIDEIISTFKAITSLPEHQSAQLFQLLNKQTDHRMQMEREMLALNKQDNLFAHRRACAGLLAGFIISLAFLIGGLYVVLQHHDVAGGTVATVDIVALTSVFIYGAQNKKSELTNNKIISKPARQGKIRNEDEHKDIEADNSTS